jgi:predicted AAA+ superfamily ATPase
MFNRLQTLSKTQSFFLFGPRGTGKSTLLHSSFEASHTLYLDLLNLDLEDQFLRAPQELKQIVEALPDTITHVIVDEIQKTPKLLDVVHQLIEQKKKIFVLSGSSARKLKRGAANLLAGRAWVYYLYPLSFLELGKKFILNDALQYGTLPKIYEFTQAEEKQQFLLSYAHTYLREEIVAEQFIRKLEPFRRFLEVSAQCNGKIINIKNIANDVGVDAKTVKQYFTILEDTMLGFFLEPFSHSFRKRLSQKPKFYYFDTGVARALARQLTLPLKLSTSAYGEAFEHYIILECLRLANYYKPEFRFSYLQTKDGAEVDLVVERPGEKTLFLEIKSGTHVNEAKLAPLKKLSIDFGDCEAICLANEQHARKIDDITVYPWQEGIKKYFTPTK